MKLLSIHIAPTPGAAMQSVEGVTAVAGQGLQGDRNFPAKRVEDQVTLIEREAVEALGRDYGQPLAPGDARRNLVTEGVALNHLVGREFSIGDVRLRGVRLCEPCTHLQKLTGVKVLPGLVHRGGLRAEVMTGGVLKPGQALSTIDNPQSKIA
jgi:MOSC domain-containing protein YiiM